MEQLKIHVLPPLGKDLPRNEGSPIIYPAEEPHDAKSVHAWLEKVIGLGTMTNCMGKAVVPSVLRQLGGEVEYTLAQQQGETQHLGGAAELPIDATGFM